MYLQVFNTRPCLLSIKPPYEHSDNKHQMWLSIIIIFILMYDPSSSIWTRNNKDLASDDVISIASLQARSGLVYERSWTPPSTYYFHYTNESITNTHQRTGKEEPNRAMRRFVSHNPFYLTIPPISNTLILIDNRNPLRLPRSISAIWKHHWASVMLTVDCTYSLNFLWYTSLTHKYRTKDKFAEKGATEQTLFISMKSFPPIHTTSYVYGISVESGSTNDG